MASAAPPVDDNNGDEGFDKLFDEFAAGRTPPTQEDDEGPAPDGNDPDDPDASASAPVEDQESVTSGQQPASADPAPAEQAPDPWAHLPEEAKAELARLQRERDDALHRAQSDAHRVAALSRKLQQRTAPGSAPQAPPKEKSEAEKALDTKIEQLKEDYGDIAEPILELLEAQRAELNQVRTAVTEVTAERQEAMIAAETRALEERHPDWRQVAASPDFAGWLEVQPPNIQQLAGSWDARESSIALTLFKTEMAEARGQQPAATAPVATQPAATTAATGNRRSQQLDAGRDVRSRPAPAASGPPEDFDAAFKYFEAKRKAANR